MERSQNRVVVFDLGEVLATPVSLISELAQRAGQSDTTCFDAAYWEHRDSYDLGASDNDYWLRVGTSLGAEFTEALVEELAAIDTDRWTDIRDDACDVLNQLHSQSVRVAVLSNAPRRFVEAIAAREWAKAVEKVFVSGFHGLAKPDPGIYSLVTTELDVQPSEVLFFDDRQVNVAAANAAGWDAVLWTSPQQMRSVLLSRGLLCEDNADQQSV